MLQNRRSFFRKSFFSAAVGAATAGGFFAMTQADAGHFDDDPTHLQEHTQNSGNFDQGLTETGAKQVHWTYTNSKGQMLSLPLLAAGGALHHPENSLLSWNYDSKATFQSTDATSQIDDKFIVFTRRSENDDLQSIAVAKRNQQTKLELVGVISPEMLLNDKQFPLPYVNREDDSIAFHSAIANFYADDVFTGILLSRRFFILMALNTQGMPRILYYLDKEDANQGTFDMDYPDYQYVDDFRVSFPRHNLTNDNKYSVFFQSMTHGLFLFHIEKDGLKLAQIFRAGDEESAEEPFLTFPQENYDWTVRTQSQAGLPPDQYLQALYNMGPQKETLLHWCISDGHHVFIALHANGDAGYKAYPRAFVRAYQPFHDEQSWQLRPFDLFNTVLSPTHHDAPDRVVFWNRSHGAAFLSLDPSEDGNYDVRLLRQLAIDEKFHREDDLTFHGTDDFFYPNQNLTKNRRKKIAELYELTKKERQKKNDTGHLLSAEKNHTHYRVHIHARTRSAVYSLDFIDNSAAYTLQNSDNNTAPQNPILFSKSIKGMDISIPTSLGNKDKALGHLPQAKHAAGKFWDKFKQDYIDTCQIQKEKLFTDEISNRFFTNQITVAEGIYRDHYLADETWVNDFHNAVIDIARAAEEAVKYLVGKGKIWTISIMIGLGTFGGFSSLLFNKKLKEGSESHFNGTYQKQYDEISKIVFSEANENSLKYKLKLIQDYYAQGNPKRPFPPYAQENVTQALKKVNALESEKTILACTHAYGVWKDLMQLNLIPAETKFHLELENNIVLETLQGNLSNSLEVASVRGPARIVAGTLFVAGMAAVVGLAFALDESGFFS